MFHKCDDATEGRPTIYQSVGGPRVGVHSTIYIVGVIVVVVSPPLYINKMLWFVRVDSSDPRPLEFFKVHLRVLHPQGMKSHENGGVSKDHIHAVIFSELKHEKLNMKLRELYSLPFETCRMAVNSKKFDGQWKDVANYCFRWESRDHYVSEEHQELLQYVAKPPEEPEEIKRAVKWNLRDHLFELVEAFKKEGLSTEACARTYPDFFNVFVEYLNDRNKPHDYKCGNWSVWHTYCQQAWMEYIASRAAKTALLMAYIPRAHHGAPSIQIIT